MIISILVWIYTTKLKLTITIQMINSLLPRVYVCAPQREQGLLREIEVEEVLCEEKRRRCVVEEQNLHQLEEQRRHLQEQIDTNVEEVQRPITFIRLLRGCTVTDHIHPLT